MYSTSIIGNASSLAWQRLGGATNPADILPVPAQGTPAADKTTTENRSSAPHPVSGPPAQRLTPDTAAQAIAMASTENSSSDDAGSSLPIGLRHGLEDIANDPVYAAKRAKELGTVQMHVLMPASDFPKNGDPASVWNAFHAKMQPVIQAMNQEQTRRSEFYNSKVAEGLPPAQIYAEMLKFVANDTAYNEYCDGISKNPAGTKSAFYQAQHDYLAGILNKATPSDTQSALESA